MNEQDSRDPRDQMNQGECSQCGCMCRSGISGGICGACAEAQGAGQA